MYPNLFKRVYQNLQGQDWINRLSSEDRQVFIEIGLIASDRGRLGGIARAQTARRDSRGRFASDIIKFWR